jgi:hypothetical protein
LVQHLLASVILAGTALALVLLFGQSSAPPLVEATLPDKPEPEEEVVNDEGLELGRERVLAPVAAGRPQVGKGTDTVRTPGTRPAPPAAPPAPAPVAAPPAAPRPITPPPSVQAVSDAPLEQEEASEEIDPEPTRVPEKKPGKRPTDSEPTYVPPPSNAPEQPDPEHVCWPGYVWDGGKCVAAEPTPSPDLEEDEMGDAVGGEDEKDPDPSPSPDNGGFGGGSDDEAEEGEDDPVVDRG